MIPPPPRRLQALRRERGPSVAGPFGFAAGIVVLVVVGLLVARPALAGAVTQLAEERPGALRNAAIREFVRSTLGDAAEQPADPAGAPRTFVVERGDNAVSVADRLARQKVISRPIVFLLPLYDSGKEESLQAGSYRVSPAMRPAELAELFQRAFGEQLVLRVIEGWRLSEIAAEVERRFPTIKGQDFLRAAVAGAYRHDFLAGVNAGTPLEGFLYPETYFFAADASAEDVVNTLLDAFQRRAGDLVSQAARKRNVRPYEIVSLAAIVEREAKARKESPTIASVFWNRIDREMPLQADPTVQYAVGSWRQLTLEDLTVDSPYNTYRNAGLPPTPISAPGQSALQAAAEPAATEYLFFVAKNDGTGEHAFAQTLEEHEANRLKYGNR